MAHCPVLLVQGPDTSLGAAVGLAEAAVGELGCSLAGVVDIAAGAVIVWRLQVAADTRLAVIGTAAVLAVVGAGRSLAEG